MLKLFKKSWIHLLIWGAMLVYFLAAPEIYTRTFTKVGRPLDAREIPAESNRVVFGVDGLEPFTKDGEKVYNLFGWAVMIPEEGGTVDSLVREVVLISDEEIYFFPVTPVYRGRPSQDKLADMELDLDTLGFYAFLADDMIKPGQYRVGLVFRDTSSGIAYYNDKPRSYLIKTRNSLDLKSK